MDRQRPGDIPWRRVTKHVQHPGSAMAEPRTNPEAVVGIPALGLAEPATRALLLAWLVGLMI
eukprot:867641-Alexandrium_andersonii.AAC.1